MLLLKAKCKFPYQGFIVNSYYTIISEGINFYIIENNLKRKVKITKDKFIQIFE